MITADELRERAEVATLPPELEFLRRPIIDQVDDLAEAKTISVLAMAMSNIVAMALEAEAQGDDARRRTLGRMIFEGYRTGGFLWPLTTPIDESV